METQPESVNGTPSDPEAYTGADLVIVSAYGRANWLAMELARQGWKIVFVDVTAQLGKWEPEDAEGPFGFFEPSEVTPSQKNRLTDESEMVAVRGGLNVWLKDGPIECHGPLTAFHFAQREISELVKNYLQHPRSAAKEIESDRKRLLKLPFREAWMAHFLHQLASPVYIENHRALEDGEASPVFAPYCIRQISRKGLRRGLEACRTAGVDVRENATVEDLRMADRGGVESFKIRDKQTGDVPARAFVWALTSAETAAAMKGLSAKLYPRGILQPEWNWMRFRVEMKGVASDDQIPAHVVGLEDPFLPWTHTNLFVLRKRHEPKHYDLWMRLPMRVRGDQEYLRGVAREAQAILQRRLPQLGVEITELPSLETAPPLVPVYSAPALDALQTVKAANLFFCGPEQNAWLDWVGNFRRQEDILVKLDKLRTQWLAVERKRLAALERRAAK